MLRNTYIPVYIFTKKESKKKDNFSFSKKNCPCPDFLRPTGTATSVFQERTDRGKVTGLFWLWVGPKFF